MDEDAGPLREYVERLALAFAGMGLQRMAARVLALFVCSDAPSLTSPDIAERLAVSPAAVSGAIHLLSRAGIVERAPMPGSRRDHYRLAGDTWNGAGAIKQDLFEALARLAGEGRAAVPPGGSADVRLSEMQAFYAFLTDEMPALLSRWRERQAGRAAAGGSHEPGPGRQGG
jgi:predicted transcriptional regulator